MQVAALYEARGCRVLARRWRGRGGEIDLILSEREKGEDADCGLIFVEVKKAPSFARAAERIGPAQIARILAAAQEYAGRQPRGLGTPMRFDAALVDAAGRIEIRAGAFP
ncbi:putative endonuclease [Profundibacterium mesophilum KAUST100406-0324]|uniref:Endonuclease n=2 Tax=Profundibacterium TaxID=1258570 RepID=A0A921NV32_9RHOB|nr:putative endonuclease [Profundibacterium mesophilum KAUST100406-0324]